MKENLLTNRILIVSNGAIQSKLKECVKKINVDYNDCNCLSVNLLNQHSCFVFVCKLISNDELNVIKFLCNNIKQRSIVYLIIIGKTINKKIFEVVKSKNIEILLCYNSLLTIETIEFIADKFLDLIKEKYNSKKIKEEIDYLLLTK